MKIANSSVAMSAEHSQSVYVSKESMAVTTRDKDSVMAGISEIFSSDKKSMLESMKKYEQNEAATLEANSDAASRNFFKNYLDQMQKCRNNCVSQARFEDMQIKMLKRLLAALSGKKSVDIFDLLDSKESNVLDLRSSSYQGLQMTYQGSFSMALGVNANTPAVGTTNAGTTWHQITATSCVYSEMESTSFKTQGLAVTEDGRSISFGVEVSMSRGFTEEFNLLTAEEFVCTDPLIINVESDITSLSDMKFRFDIDSDGKEEEISMTGKGSGFLALDKNGDGKINDGNELFGTKSGNGFKDLAAYDEDGNGWIDENDSVYSKLRVWFVNPDGTERLINLKEADVGAIYLGSEETEFSLKNDDNKTNGIIRRTGVYLKESGGAGTISHVDMAV